MPGLPRGRTNSPTATIVAVLVVAAIIIGAVLWMQRNSSDRRDLRETELKAGLHSIQLAVQQYEVDNSCFPPWLIGGEARFASRIDSASERRPFQEIRDCPDPAVVSDPLLRGGYMTAYPKNPFARSGLGIHLVQENLPTAAGHNDPLRNGSASGATYGTRFGADCTRMGSVLADPRYRHWAPVGSNGEQLEQEPTYCNVEYEFWDVWVGRPPLPYLPGQFFYKAAGPVAIGDPEISENQPVLPTESTEYILGCYGGPHVKGQDVLGEEQRIELTASSRTRGGEDWLALGDPAADAQQGESPSAPVDTAKPPTAEHPSFWPWTRGEVSPDPTARAGSPYGLPRFGTPRQSFPAGNGICDAIIFMVYSDRAAARSEGRKQ